MSLMDKTILRHPKPFTERTGAGASLKTLPATPGAREDEGTDAPRQKLVLDNFLLSRALGRGSYATAYLAKQVGTDRDAVVKIAHPNLLHGEQAEIIRERFAIEARASTRVQHPNLITVYMAGEVDGMPAIAMEYAPGVTLARHLHSCGPLPEEDILEIFAPLADALAALHENGIIHRDLSPNNIVLKESGEQALQPKILDFGISQLDGVSKHTTGPIGTPQFMAPELLRGDSGPAVDLFSLGQLCWWAMTGEPMIPGDISSLEAFKMLHALEKSPDFEAHAMARYSGELLAVVQGLLDPEPGARPSAREVEGVLSSLVAGTSSPSTLDHENSVPQELIDEFLELLPRWLFDIETALLSNDRSALFSLCGEISSRALVLRENHLTEVTRALLELDPESYQQRGLALCQQLGEECKQVFDRAYAPAPATP